MIRNYKPFRIEKGLERLVGININYGFDPIYEKVLSIEFSERQVTIVLFGKTIVLVKGNPFKQKIIFVFGGTDESNV